MISLEVCDYMNVHPVKLLETMAVAEAVECLLRTKQTGGPVVDAKGRVVGFLSEQDCLQRMIESSYYREHVCRVHEIMNAPALTVKPYTSVLELAQMLLKERPRVYPVIDDEGSLVGTINRAAVLRAIDEQLQSGYRKIAM
ncbi:CBS domain-containing protein [Alteromonas pelagimontana]|uniref:CBS domain-containing protein n=1 Tax=Alteromonas pelagimontana TaxID=1858656 RepID=A0A6M4M924_9ALTE|nr:CBS domain-containing protein [Alteromonas pelagimontana]QJR79479.1 CBS domain-containing protein [Alteromonas pelagimontana]